MLAPRTAAGALLWASVRGLSGGLRRGMDGSVIGLDWQVVMEAARANGLGARAVATLLPWIEAGLMKAVESHGD